MTRRFRQLYGAGPLHLVALLASLVIAGAAAVRWFDFTGPDTLRVLIWFAGAIVGHDLVLLPLYSLLDRIAFGAHAANHPRGFAEPPPWLYVRVPALLSGLLLLVFFPEIFRLGGSTFHVAAGQTQDPYLVRWLLACGALFALSGLACAAALSRRRRRRL